jgi:hypothetical protein
VCGGPQVGGNGQPLFYGTSKAGGGQGGGGIGQFYYVE